MKVRGMRVEPGEVDAVLNTYPGGQPAEEWVCPVRLVRRSLVSYVTPVRAARSSRRRDRLRGAVAAFAHGAAVGGRGRRVRADPGRQDRPFEAADRRLHVGDDFVCAAHPARESVIADVFAQTLGLGAGQRPRRVLRTRRQLTVGHQARGGAVQCDRASGSGEDALRGAQRCRHVRGHRNADRGPSCHRWSPGSGPGSCPCRMRSGMWLLNRADPDSAAYNIAFALRLVGDLDLGALRTPPVT